MRQIEPYLLDKLAALEKRRTELENELKQKFDDNTFRALQVTIGKILTTKERINGTYVSVSETYTIGKLK